MIQQQVPVEAGNHVFQSMYSRARESTWALSPWRYAHLIDYLFNKAFLLRRECTYFKTHLIIVALIEFVVFILAIIVMIVVEPLAFCSILMQPTGIV